MAEYKAAEVREKDFCIIGKKEPTAYPLNCRTRCRYGYGKSFCYPCIAKILEESKKDGRITEKPE